ncbi:MAG: 4Fe-4S dicluster domain-containing protein [Fibrobacterota bacterium]
MPEIERETLDVDVLFVGGGPAALAGIYRLNKLINEHNCRIEEKGEGEKLEEVMILLIEKGAEIGSNILSGAVMDPKGIAELIPEWEKEGAPVETDVTADAVYFLTEKKSFKYPVTPPPMVNHGNKIISLTKFTRWLKEKCEENGEVEIMPGYPGVEILFDGSRVTGVRTGDMGIDKEGKQKANFEPGININAKVTVFAEGSKGLLAKDLIKKNSLDYGKNPQSYATGVKEVWEIPADKHQKGRVIHTMGYPFSQDTMGGSFIYFMDDNKVSIGLTGWLNYRNPYLDLHKEFNRLKQHPFVKNLLDGGKMVEYGAKTMANGGLYSMPRLFCDGALIAGDSASFLDPMKLKGIHLALLSGKLAAETVFDSLLKKDFSSKALSRYEEEFKRSWGYADMRKSRNFHQSYEKVPMAFGLVRSGIQMFLRGRDWSDKIDSEKDSVLMETIKKYPRGSNKAASEINFDNKLTIDKLTDIYSSGTNHEEDQPSHCRIPDPSRCMGECREKYDNPCLRFCPAQVYELDRDPKGSEYIKINFSNCLHCKTCEIKDPLGNVSWNAPEGGGGPNYSIM